MKKILILYCIATLHSCSSSDDLNAINSTNEKTTSQSRPIIEYTIEYAETIFPVYFLSTEYANTTNEIQLFYSKFNNNELAKSLKTKKNLLAYIENNLTATKFSSKEEAVQILARIKAYQEIEQTKFQEVYSFIKFADISTLKLAFNNWEPTTIIYDKNSSCYFESVACSDAAREEYMMLTKMQMNGNGVFEDQSEVRGYYQATQNCCAEAYLECIKG